MTPPLACGEGAGGGRTPPLACGEASGGGRTPPLACGVSRRAPPSLEAMCACSRRQVAHAEKSLAVRELVRLSLRVQSTGVVAELHLDTALVATSGSGADHERRIRRGCQATDGRADNWRGRAC